MPRPKKQTEKPEPTERQQEIAAIRANGRVPKDSPEGQRLRQLLREESRERFCRLAPKRLTNAVKSLHRLSAIGNRNSYVYSDAEADYIRDEIAKAVNVLLDAIAPQEAAAEKGFQFDANFA